MRPIFWVAALAVLSLASAKNSTEKAKPKRQLDSIRSPQNLQYSLVLPHSSVSHYRSHSTNRRISHGTGRAHHLPPYAVQMEPVVQYSQKDPLYDPNQDNFDDAAVNKNELYAQPKILNLYDQQSEQSFGPPFGGLPTAPLYSQEPHPHYYEAPEPIIEIIIKESNETLPAPPPQPIQKKKKEPVQVFYVKYSKDPHSNDKVIYDKPIAAITPPSNDEDHQEDYVTVTPEPIVYDPPPTTTFRAIIKPESEVYHSDSSVKVTFGSESHHQSDRRESDVNTEDHEETAPRPAIAHPQQPLTPSLERSATPRPQYHETTQRQEHNHHNVQNYRSSPQAQSRIQFQQPYVPNEQQLPRQGPSASHFRSPTHVARQNSFGAPPPFGPNPSFQSSQNPNSHFNNAPTLPGPVGPFPTTFPRQNNAPPFHPRPNHPPPNHPPPNHGPPNHPPPNHGPPNHPLQSHGPPPSHSPPFTGRPHFNGPPPRSTFHSGPQRPFFPSPQPSNQPFFDEAKYLQENYHTITTEQVEPPKEQVLPNRQPNFNFIPKPSQSPSQSQFQEFHSRPQHIPVKQQLPQQRPPQQFADNSQHKPAFPSSGSASPFFNLKPSPPHIENNRPPFHHPTSNNQQSQFGFHQGPQPIPRPSQQLPNQQTQHSFQDQFIASPSPIPQHQFLPQPSSPPVFNFHSQPQGVPERHQHTFEQKNLPSEIPQFSRPNGPSERPNDNHQSSFHSQTNLQHQQNVGQFVPNGGELVAAIPKYEQHITVQSPSAPSDYSSLSQTNQPSASSSQLDHQYQHQIQQQKQHQIEQQHQQQIQQHNQQIQQQIQNQQQAENQEQQRQQQQQFYDLEQEQVRLQLAQNVQKQQDEIQRLQAQLHQAQQHQQKHQYQQQHQPKQYEPNYQSRNNYNHEKIQATSPKPQYETSRPAYVSSTSSPPYYQSTSRTVEIKPTTQKYVSSTLNSINPTQEAKKEEKKKRPTIELPDEVPDDLRQQLLSSGILDNADISVLDYDKVGDTPLDSLPPDQLANFFSAGGGQQIAASENRPIIVTPDGEQIESRIDDDDEQDQEIAASENIPSYVAPPPSQGVEMKVVHFDPKTAAGQSIAKDYVKEDATRLDTVALNDKKYNRYLPLKVSGNQFPVPDVLKGRKVTSVVVLAPVETEALNAEHSRAERATASNTLKGIKFVAGDTLQDVLKKPTTENFQKWLENEKKTATDLQSVVLLVTDNEEPAADREIFMYDITSGTVNKLNGELSNAFVEAAENNSLSKDIEKLAIEGEGTPENFSKDDEDKAAQGSENVPLLVDLSGISLEHDDANSVSISSGYSKTKLGRSLRRQ